MNLDQLLALRAVIETGSFRAAAEKLHKAQSAISYQIKSLEDALGFEVLDRSTYRAQLTAKGKNFYEKSLHLLNQFSSLEDFAKQIKMGVETKVHLSVSAIFPIEKLFNAFKEFENQFPKTSLKLSSDVLSGAQRLEAKICDMAIVEGDQNLLLSKFESVNLGRVCMLPVASYDHPLTKFQDVNIEDLVKYKHIVLRSTEISGDDPVAGVQSNAKTWSVSDFATKNQLLLQGLGWGLMPDYMVNENIKNKKLKVLHSKDYKDLGVEFILIARRETHGPATNNLWQKISQLSL